MSIADTHSLDAAMKAGVPLSIRLALGADALAWSAESTGGGCMAWSADCEDGAASVWICDDGNGLGDSESSYFLIGLHPHAEWNDHYGTEAPTIAEALATARAIMAARAFALGFRPSPVWSDDFASQPDAVARLADAFRDVLQEWIGTVGMAKVRCENVALAGTGSCASHNYCDANMAMDEAMKRTFGAGPLDGPQEHMTDIAMKLWADAWDKAKADYLTDAA